MKKLISVLLIMVMLMSVCVLSGSAALPSIGVLGDVDMNDDINVMDVTYIQRMVADLVAYDAEDVIYADVDLNSTVTVMDATNLQRWIAGLLEDSKIGDGYSGFITCHDFYSDYMSGSAMVGVPVTFTSVVVAESPMQSYELYVNDSLVAASTDSSSLTYAFQTAGKYDVKMVSNAFYGTVERGFSDFVVEEYEENSALSIKTVYTTGKYRSDYIYDYDGVVAYAEGMGGTAPYEYKFMFGYPTDLKNPSSTFVYVYQEYSSDNSYELPMIESGNFGRYTECVLKVRVMDAKGEIVEYVEDIVYQHPKIG